MWFYEQMQEKSLMRLYKNTGTGGDAKLIIMLMWTNIRKREVIVLLSLNPHTSFHLLSIHNGDTQ